MTGTFIVPELGADFTDQFQKIAIDYIFAKWSISDPAKGASQMDDTVSLRFKTGFADYYKPYEVTAMFMGTEAQQTELGSRAYEMKSYVDVGVRMKRLARDAVDPQLNNMAKEVERIAAQYVTVPQDITGVKDILYRGWEPIFDSRDNFAKSNWQAVVHIGFWYEMRDVS